jgi:hypothetical protein
MIDPLHRHAQNPIPELLMHPVVVYNCLMVESFKHEELIAVASVCKTTHYIVKKQLEIISRACIHHCREFLTITSRINVLNYTRYYLEEMESMLTQLLKFRPPDLQSIVAYCAIELKDESDRPENILSAMQQVSKYVKKYEGYLNNAYALQKVERPQYIFTYLKKIEEFLAQSSKGLTLEHGTNLASTLHGLLKMEEPQDSSKIRTRFREFLEQFSKELTLEKLELSDKDTQIVKIHNYIKDFFLVPMNYYFTLIDMDKSLDAKILGSFAQRAGQQVFKGKEPMSMFPLIHMTYIHYNEGDLLHNPALANAWRLIEIYSLTLDKFSLESLPNS